MDRSLLRSCGFGTEKIGQRQTSTILSFQTASVKIKILTNEKDWKELFNNSSNDFELIIYKFSPICGLSLLTDSIIDNWCNLQREKSNLVLLRVDVVNNRELSKKIADDLAIKHESPQIIWLEKNKELKFQASHYDITIEALNKKL